MSVLQTRGGFPVIFNATVTTSGREHSPRVQTSYVQVYTTTNPVRVYFTEDDFTNDEHYIEVPIAAAANPWGWEGPVELGWEGKIWFKGLGGDAGVTAIFYQRRG